MAMTVSEAVQALLEAGINASKYEDLIQTLNKIEKEANDGKHKTEL